MGPGYYEFECMFVLITVSPIFYNHLTGVGDIEQDLATKKKGRTQLIREIERLRGLRDSRVWHIL